MNEKTRTPGDVYADAGFIRLAGTIGDHGLDALALSSALARQSGAIVLRSGGGNFDDGLAMAQIVRQSGRVVFADYAGSVAALILAAGRRRILAANGWLLIHSGWTFTGGRPELLRRHADQLDMTNAAMTEALASYSGQSLDTVRAWLQSETVFSPAEALAAGLIDEIGPAMAAPVRAPQSETLAADLDHIQQGAESYARRPDQINAMVNALATIDDAPAFAALVSTRHARAWPTTPATRSAAAHVELWARRWIQRHRDQGRALPTSPPPGRWVCPRCHSTNFHPPVTNAGQPAACPHCTPPAPNKEP